MPKNNLAINGDVQNVQAPSTSPTGFQSVSRMLDVKIVTFPFDGQAGEAHLSGILKNAVAGKPLQRSDDFNALASKASKMRGAKPASGKAWAARLAQSLTSQND